MQLPPKRFSSEAVALLTTYGWGGNIRELENFVRYMLVTGEKELIVGADLPKPMIDTGQRRRRSDRQRPPGRPFSGEDTEQSRGLPFGVRTWGEVERDYVLYLMKANSWNITRAAKMAGINRSTFVSRMRRLGIEKKR